MILDAVRRKFINKLRRDKESTKNESFEFSKIKSVGCIIDLDKYENPNHLISEFKQLGLSGAEFKIIGFSRKNSKQKEDTLIPVFYKNEVGIKGKLKGENLQNFVDGRYDVLINYFAEDVFEMKLVSLMVKASITAGFPTVDQKCNDLILNCEYTNVKQFFEILKRYLKVIKK
ncbi:DUF6913 domain-containing protein [Neptunitalea lumnitzerae]|uniref:Uncharacterized protein n=1 Tax=Neptunitalea lumnitzerae TaxID=2965509 RepID=A0ABQ5MK35_9FLAO|nr:hypothetical protein [Neptunitalea sp. Y10]GLB49749.1 hypothetical protein Y10_21170 [Neptunitalea sp. Y10]